MVTFTSTLPEDVFKRLNETSGKLAVPKNKIIIKALRISIDHLTRSAYAKSDPQSAEDFDIIEMAEEGMEDYLKQLDE